MIKFREYKSVKMLCMFLAGLILYTSCNPDNLPVIEGCTQLSLGHLDKEQIASHFELMLDYARSVDQQEDYSSLKEFHQTLFGDTEESTKYVETYKEEEQKYLKMGFEGYVENSETISNGLKNYFINYSKRLTSFLTNDRPDLEQFTEFISQQKSDAYSSDLCDNDQNLMQAYLSITQGYGNWYYKHYFDSSEGNADLRGCNFWQGLLCGLLALVVGLVVAVVAFVVVLVATIFVNGQEVGEDVQGDLAILAGLALGIYVGVNIYKWCCNKDEIDEQTCVAPSGSTFIETACNTFEYRVFGPSTYANTSWTNTNATPATATTPTPTITVSVPSFGNPSTMTADITCVGDASTVSIYSWDETLTFGSSDLFPLGWATAPPSSYNWVGDDGPGGNGPGPTGFNTIYASVDVPWNSGVYSYNWSVNSPNTIFGGGGTDQNFVNIELAGPGINLTTTVTVTNNCTGQANTISKSTYVN